MSGEFFVQVMRQDGSLGALYGPGTWDACIEKVKKLLAAGGEEATQLSELEEDQVESDGSFEFGDGGGVYTICAEPLETEEPETSLFDQETES